MSLLYSRFAPRMLRVIARYVDDKDDAQDILHDGFIAAFTRLESLREPERVEYWLATIMKNLSLKFLQSQNIETILDSLPNDVAEDADVDEVIDFDTLESLIKQLPAGYQKVFRLAVLENKSHKEISKILGIAPNSSSSQLFHAKIMFRKLLNDYKKQAALMGLMLLAFIVGILFKPRHEDLKTETLLSVADESSRITVDHPRQTPVEQQEKPADRKPVRQIIRPKEKTTEASADMSQAELADNASHSEPVESVIESTESYRDLIAETSIIDDVIEGVVGRSSKRKRAWSAGVAFDSGLLSFENWKGTGDLVSPPPDNPDDPQTPDDNVTTTPMKAPRANSGLIEKLRHQSHKNSLPVTFSLTAERRLSSWVGVETGISYTYLRTDFEDVNVNTICHWHYLELPVKANIYVYRSRRFSFYGSFGAKLSVPVYSNASAQTHSSDIKPIEGGRFDSNPVWSAGGSLGVSYRLSDRLHLYVEPSLQYHFPHDYQVPNTWTDDPWTFSIPIGIRFSW